jgi:shikimate dehydrogenase
VLTPVRCAVLGSPIGHSLSPVLHRAAYAELGLDWRYDAVEVDEQGLAEFLDGLGEEWRGLSLTMPLKRAVVPLADSLDERTRVSGVGNTVVLDHGRRLVSNTDIPGAVAALVERGLGEVGDAVVLGGGATATSVLLALAELGCARATVLVRDPSRAEETVAVVRAGTALALEVGVLGSDVPRTDLLVSTIPAAAQDPGVVSAAGAVFEVVYDPWPTPLAAAASRAGLTVVTGLDLLAHQAVLQVELMTGSPVTVDVVRAAAESELLRRA